MRRRKEAASRNASNFHGIPFIVVVGRSIPIEGSDEETGKARSGGEAVENRRAGGASGQRPPRSLLPRAINTRATRENVALSSRSL